LAGWLAACVCVCVYYLPCCYALLRQHTTITTCKCLCVCVCVCVCVKNQIKRLTVHARTYTRTHARMYTRTHTRTYTCTQTNTHTQSKHSFDLINKRTLPRSFSSTSQLLSALLCM
jgi:hypothetical protein